MLKTKKTTQYTIETKSYLKKKKPVKNGVFFYLQ